MGSNETGRQRRLFRNISREKLIAGIDEAIAVVEKSLSKLKDEDLGKEFPIKFLEEKRTTGWILLTLANHLNYHLGQLNYHRRLV